jgi:hypothetical protein
LQILPQATKKQQEEKGNIREEGSVGNNKSERRMLPAVQTLFDVTGGVEDW